MHITRCMEMIICASPERPKYAIETEETGPVIYLGILTEVG